MQLAPPVKPADLQYTPTSHSQDEEFKRCRRRWAYHKLLNADDEEDAKALVYGGAGHHALEQVFRGKTISESMAEGIALIDKEAQGQKWHKAIREWLPFHVQGFFAHFYPGFNEKWEVVAVEQKGDHYLSDIIWWRGMLDLICRNRHTGGYAIFDFKFSSDQYVESLSQVLSHSPQLARYTMAFYRLYNQWPEEVGYIFLKKPKYQEAPTNLMSDPTKYVMKSQTVTPAFANYSISIEDNDIQSALEMRRYRKNYHERGVASLNEIPANFGACFQYFTMCGFAGGCHSGKPLHTQMKDAA